MLADILHRTNAHFIRDCKVAKRTLHARNHASCSAGHVRRSVGQQSRLALLLTYSIRGDSAFPTSTLQCTCLFHSGTSACKRCGVQADFCNARQALRRQLSGQLVFSSLPRQAKYWAWPLSSVQLTHLEFLVFREGWATVSIHKESQICQAVAPLLDLKTPFHTVQFKSKGMTA